MDFAFFFFFRMLKGIFFPVGTFSGPENYLHLFQKKRARNRITEPGNHCPEGIAVCQPPSSSSGQAKTEIRSTFNCGKNLSLAAYKLSTFYAYLMPFFFFFVFSFENLLGLSYLMATNLRGRQEKERGIK